MLKNSSPAKNTASSAAPKTPTRVVAAAPQRYLQGIVFGFENGVNKWHLVTTLPDNFRAKCDELGADIMAWAAGRTGLPEDHNKLAEKIYGCIFGSNGVYYLVTERNGLNNAAHFAPHMMQTLIIEKRQNIKIGDADHISKAKNVLTMFSRIATKIRFLQKKIQKDDPAPALHNKFDEFLYYLNMQAECIRDAVNYDASIPPLTDMAVANIPTQELDQRLLAWHPDALMQQTPVKEATPHRRAVAEHPGSKRIRSSTNSVVDENAPLPVSVSPVRTQGQSQSSTLTPAFAAARLTSKDLENSMSQPTLPGIRPTPKRLTFGS